MKMQTVEVKKRTGDGQPMEVVGTFNVSVPDSVGEFISAHGEEVAYDTILNAYEQAAVRYYKANGSIDGFAFGETQRRGPTKISALTAEQLLAKLTPEQIAALRALAG